MKAKCPACDCEDFLEVRSEVLPGRPVSLVQCSECGAQYRTHPDNPNFHLPELTYESAQPAKTAEVEWKDGSPIHIRPATLGNGFVCCLECEGWSWKRHVMGGLVPCEAPRCVGGLVCVGAL